MVALVAETEPDIREALTGLKRLEQSGWIDLTYYARLDKGAHDAVRVREVSDPVEAVNQTAGEGLAGTLGNSLFGPVEAPAAGAAPCRAYALLVITEAQYAERVVEELEARGFTQRRQLQGAERQAALRASIERLKTNVQWLDDFLRGELVKAGRAHGHDKEEIEATAAAGRAELGAEREKLHARLRALASELESDLRHAREQLLEAIAADSRDALNRHIGRIEGAIMDCGQDLALSILDHMDCLASHAMQIQAEAAAAAEAAKTIEGQLHELEVRMRKYRAEQTATLGAFAVRARRCLDHLRDRAAPDQRELKQALNEQMRKVDERHQLLKADLRRLEKEDTRVWHERAAGLRRSWRELFDSLRQAIRQYR
jgi:hypothetical protein